LKKYNLRKISFLELVQEQYWCRAHWSCRCLICTGSLIFIKVHTLLP